MKKYIFKKGIEKKTKNQTKKHFTQFSKKEFDFLENKIKSLKNIRPSWHLIEKEDISIKKDDILNVLRDSNIKELIIEYNLTKKKYNKDERVLLRSRDEYLIDSNEGTVRCNLCFVLSLSKGEVVTAYYNDTTDNHSTIRWDRYDENLKII